MRRSYVLFFKINSTDSCPSPWIRQSAVAPPLYPHPGGGRRRTPVLAVRIDAGVITLTKETFSDKVEGTPRRGRRGRVRRPACRCDMTQATSRNAVASASSRFSARRSRRQWRCTGYRRDARPLPARASSRLSARGEGVTQVISAMRATTRVKQRGAEDVVKDLGEASYWISARRLHNVDR